MERTPKALETEAVLSRLGSVVTPGLNRPFSIEERDRVWLVELGALDLHLISPASITEDGEVEGPRNFVTRVEAGRLVWGFPPNESLQTGSGRMAAVASPDTVLRQLSRADLYSALEGPSGAVVPELTEKWVEELSALTGQPPPKAFSLVKAGTTFNAGFNARVLMPKDGVLWVRQIAGVSHVLGQPDLALEPGAHFPFSRHLWLEAAPSSELRILDWHSWQLEDPGWTGLDDFQRVMLDRLVRNQVLAEVQERGRLSAKAEMDSLRVATAMTRLSTPLEPAAGVKETSAEGISDPLLSAAQAVGEALGLRIKPFHGMQRGLKPKDPVAAIGRASSVHTRRVLLKEKWWTEDSGPILAFREQDNCPVALLPRGAGHYDLYNPAERSTTSVDAAVAGTLNGFGYIFYRPFAETKLGARDLLKFGLFGCKGDLLHVFWTGMGGGLLAMLVPIVSGILFDTVIPSAQRGQLQQLAVVLVASAVSSALFLITQNRAVLRLEGKLDSSVQAAVWDRLLSLPVPFFRDYTAGDLAVRGMGINQMRQVLTGSTLSAILAGIFSTFSFTLLFYYSWRLALLATLLTAVAFVVSLACGYIQVGYQRDMSAIKGRISGTVLQFIAGIAKLRISGSEDRAFASWSGEFTKQKTIAARSRRTQNNLSVFSSTFPVICSACIFYFTAKLLADPQQSQISTGDFVAFNSAFTQFVTAVLRLSTAAISVLAIVPLYERAKPIFQTLPEVTAAKSDPG